MPYLRPASRREKGVEGRVFERFTERARQVVVLAQDEARALKHNYIGTEHILLGSCARKKGSQHGARVPRHHGRGGAGPGGAHRGPGRRGDDGPDPVHAARQEGAGAGAARGALPGPQLHRHGAHPARARPRERRRRRRILLDFDADAEKIRNEIIRMLSGPGAARAVRAEPPARSPSPRSCSTSSGAT